MAWYWPFAKREREYSNPWLQEERQSYGLNQLLAMSGVPSYSGVSVSPDSAMRHSAVWDCVNKIAGTISTLPVDCFRNGEEVLLPPILRAPSAEVSWIEWLYAVVAALLTRGNVYGQVVERHGGLLLPTQIELLDNDTVSVRRNDEGKKEIRVNGEVQDKDSIWHVRAFTMPGQLEGLSLISYAKQSIGLGLAYEKFASQFFGQGGVPTGVIEFPVETTVQQAKKFRDAWDQEHTSASSLITPDRATGYKTAFIGGGAKYAKIQIPPEDSQFLGGINANNATIARFFGIPPEMIGASKGDSLTYANLDEQSLHFLKYGVGPWIVRLDRVLSDLLPRGTECKIKPDAILRTTTRQRYEAYSVAIRAGFMTPNEARELENLPPLPGGNELVKPKATNNRQGKDNSVEPWVMS